jgi:exoribonuclease R
MSDEYASQRKKLMGEMNDFDIEVKNLLSTLNLGIRWSPEFHAAAKQLAQQIQEELAYSGQDIKS